MRHFRTAALVVSLVVPLALNGQYRSRRATSATARAGGLQGVTITIHGTLKNISKKELLLESDENQLITIRCNGKTKFYELDNTMIKPTAIDLESRVTVEASEDLDSKLLAVSIKVNDPNQRTLSK